MKKLSLREIIVFSLLGTIMFLSKLLMDALPNIHIIAALITVYTLVFRAKALYPLYIFVFLTGLYGGFNMWWLPYLYIWTVLWAVVMLLPKKMKPAVAFPVYMTVCGLHGLCYGTLYAPVQAMMYGLSFKKTVAWIIAGLPYDAIHGLGNAVASLLVLPLTAALKKTIGKK